MDTIIILVLLLLLSSLSLLYWFAQSMSHTWYEVSSTGSLIAHANNHRPAKFPHFYHLMEYRVGCTRHPTCPLTKKSWRENNVSICKDKKKNMQAPIGCPCCFSSVSFLLDGRRRWGIHSFAPFPRGGEKRVETYLGYQFSAPPLWRVFLRFWQSGVVCISCGWIFLYCPEPYRCPQPCRCLYFLQLHSHFQHFAVLKNCRYAQVAEYTLRFCRVILAFLSEPSTGVACVAFCFHCLVKQEGFTSTLRVWNSAESLDFRTHFLCSACRELWVLARHLQRKPTGRICDTVSAWASCYAWMHRRVMVRGVMHHAHICTRWPHMCKASMMHWNVWTPPRVAAVQGVMHHADTFTKWWRMH